MKRQVTLVIPGRNCAQTIRPCLEAVVAILKSADSPLQEIIFVNDHSTDATTDIVAEFPVSCLLSAGRGAGAARNTGWRAAETPLIWFVDADCVAESDALDRLLPHMDDPQVGGVSGSYGIMNAESLLACLIHEEIVERHLRMGRQVDFLATFNVLYRRKALDRVAGFDEQFLKGQDAELSFRIAQAGYALHFELASRVRHFHPTRWLRYLRTQRQQGYWRVFLHARHRGHSAGDSYSNLLDHAAPPLAMLSIGSAPLLMWPYVRWIAPACAALVALAQLPMILRLLQRLRRPRYLAFGLMAFLRSYWRGWGATHGLLKYLLSSRLGR